MKPSVIIIIILLLILLILFVYLFVHCSSLDPNSSLQNKNKNKTLVEKFNNSNPGLLITMLSLESDDDIGSIDINKCIKLGSISKPETNIIDFTLLNKKLPINIYNSNKHITNYGIILDTELLIPQNFPDKYIQCCGVRDRGSDLRRCDTDFSNKLNHRHHRHHTIGKYDGFKLRSPHDKCDCVYVNNVSNACNSKAEVVGCGAKCSEHSKICGQVNWCSFDDFASEPQHDGLDCAIHPKDMNEFIQATIDWNKARIQKGWDIPHPENELDAYIANNDENQKMIIDSIMGFVFTEYCGSKQCSSKILKKVEHQMKIAVADFNKFYDKNISLYKMRIDPDLNMGVYKKDGHIISWEENNFTSDLESLLVKIDVNPRNTTKPASMYTYRIASDVDGIGGKNTGDIKGDNSYISGEFCHRHGDDYCKHSVMTQYKVNYLPINPPIPARDHDHKTCKYDVASCKITQQGFGNYAICNPGGVIGGTVEKNGKYICSRCSDKEIPDFDTYCKHAPGVELDRFSGGKWFSWPNQTRCDNGVPIGTDGCSWNVEEDTKSFKINELQEKGYKLLLNDDYKLIEEKCEGHDDTHSCIKKEISNFIQKNSNNNISVLEKAFT